MTSLYILALHGFLLFVGAELIFSLTPGPTVMLISAYGFKGGFRDALAAIAGTQTGNTLWYVICVTGLGALVTASPFVFHVIRLLGAAYLVFLGLSALWKSWHAAAEAQGPRLMGKPYVQATLTQMGNPKAILFFGALVPQFLDTTAPLLTQYVIMYAVTFIGEAIILTGYGALAAIGGRTAGLRHAVWRERISGLVLLSLGVLAALYSA
jgi:threonine/homoserine/homoserine lactone efflux protein